MLENKLSQFLIAGTNSGSGKTTITLGILRALARRGLDVAPFKCGPDYIDPMFHRQAAGCPSINLDNFFHSLDSYNQYAHYADVAITEGVMGLFDGSSSDSIAGSSGEVAAILQIPVVLVVNARGLSGSIAPLVKGFVSWNTGVRIVGVIANNIGSNHHAELLRNALQKANLPPLIGFLLRNERWTLPERHLGLATGTLEEFWLNALADEIEQTLDIDLLLSLTKMKRPQAQKVTYKSPYLRLGVAIDEAFCFYYEDNFNRLKQHGIEIVPFSPLHETKLPKNLNGLYLGGGYPELYAQQLSSNTPMLNAIREFSKEHLVYGECGGYLYLLDAITDFDGNRHELLQLLSGEAVMNHKLAALGYREVSGDWGVMRGHEFHYSSITSPPVMPALWKAADLHGRSFSSGNMQGRVKGSYIHLHFASSVHGLKKFIQELES